MKELEQLLYDLGNILKERHKLYIYGIFEASTESFLKKGIESTEGVTSLFQGYIHRYEDGTENNTYLFTIGTPAKYNEWMLKPRTSWRIITDHKNYYHHTINPPGSVKALVLKDLEQLKEYLVSELEEDRKRRERAIKKVIAPAIKLLKGFKKNSAKRFYLEEPINEFIGNPSPGKLNEVKKQMKSVGRESIKVKRK